MAAKAKLEAVLTMDSSPFFRSLNKALAFSKAAARQFGKQPFRTTAIVAGLGGAGAIRGIASGIVGAAKIGVQALKYLSVAGGGVAAIFAAGAIEAIHLGGTLDDLSNRTGQTVANVLVLRKAFDLAGIGADEVGVFTNRLQRALSGVNEKGESTARTFAMLGLDIGKLRQMDAVGQFQAIGDAINKMPNAADRAAVAIQIFGRAGGQVLQLFRDPNTFRQATESLGKQTGILERNAAFFGAIEDKASRIKDKIQGFFVGVDDKIGHQLYTLLDKLGSTDLTKMGQGFGDGIARGVEFLIGAVRNFPVFIATLGEGLKGAGLELANVVANGFMAAGKFLIGALESLGPIITGIGKSWEDYVVGGALAGTAALIRGFAMASAALTAGIEVGVSYLKFNFSDVVSAFNNKWVQAILNPVGALGSLLAGVAVSFGKAIFAAMTGNVPGAVKQVTDLISLPGRVGKMVDAMQTGMSADKPLNFGEQYKKDYEANVGGALGNVLNGIDGSVKQHLEAASGVMAGAMTEAGAKLKAASAALGSTDLTADTFGAKAHLDAAARGAAYLTKQGAADPLLQDKSAMTDAQGRPIAVSPQRQIELEGQYGKRRAYGMIFGKDVGEKKFQDENQKRGVSDSERRNLVMTYGPQKVNEAERSGQLVNLARPQFAPGSPVNGTGGMSLSYKGSGQGSLINMLGQTGAFSDLNTRLTGGGLGGINSATSTIARNPDGSPAFDGNAFLAATGTIHGYSSMNRLNADFKKAGLNKDNPTLAAQKAAAHNTYLTARALGENGIDSN